MSINSLSAAQKQQNVTNFLAYLDSIQAGRYDFRNEEIALLNSDGIAGLSTTEITTLKNQLINFNAAGASAATYDLDADGNASDDIEKLNYIINGRTQVNNSLRLANADEVLVTGLKHHFVTKGGYRIDYEGQNTYIHDAQGNNLAVVHGDPHVDERNVSAQWHFGDDSTFILPDGTKIYFNTQGSESNGVYVTTGLIIDDGSKIMLAGTVQVGGKTFTANTATEVNQTTFGADASLFSDVNLADKGSFQHAGVFVYSQDANNGQGGWAIKTAEGKFEDVKAESWGAYLAVGGSSFAGQVEGTVQVSREARIAALDGANVTTVSNYINQGLSLAVIDSYLDMLAAGATQNNKDSFARLVTLGVNEATLRAYASSRGDDSTRTFAAYNNMINGGVSKEIIEGFATLTNPNDTDRLEYSRIANMRPDFNLNQLKDYIGLMHRANAGETSNTAYEVIRTKVTNQNISGSDISNFVNFANRYPTKDTDTFEGYTSLLLSNASNSVLDSYDRLIGLNTNATNAQGFLAVYNDPNIAASRKDATLNGYVTLANQGNSRALDVLMSLARSSEVTNGIIEKYTAMASRAGVPQAANKAFEALVLKTTQGITAENREAKLSELNTALDNLNSGATTISETALTRIEELALAGTDLTKLNQVISFAKTHSSTLAINSYLNLVNQNASARTLNAFSRIALLNSDSHFQSFTDINSKTADANTKESWLEELADYVIEGSGDKINVLKDLVNLNYAGSRAFIAGAGNIARALEVRSRANSATVYPILTRLHDAGINSAGTLDGLMRLVNNNASAIKLNAFATAHERKQANDITALNKYLDLNASDDFLQAFTDYISGNTTGAAAKVGTANTLIALKETIGARTYPPTATGDNKFARDYANQAMIAAIDTLVTSIVSNSSAHISNPEVIARANSELAKLNVSGASARSQLVAVLTASTAIRNGLNNIDTAITNINSSVATEYNRIVGGASAGTTNKLIKLYTSKITTLNKRKQSTAAQLAAIPAGATDMKSIKKRQQLTNKLATYERIVTSYEAKLEAITDNS